LFGHQAFAVNYAHEAVEERRDLQQLLRPEWATQSRRLRAHALDASRIRKDCSFRSDSAGADIRKPVLRRVSVS
jgi:hypothetical protein